MFRDRLNDESISPLVTSHSVDTFQIADQLDKTNLILVRSDTGYGHRGNWPHQIDDMLSSAGIAVART